MPEGGFSIWLPTSRIGDDVDLLARAIAGDVAFDPGSLFRPELDERIATLEAIRNRLTTCIGCGCLSLKTCGLLNPGDEAASLGGGAHYLHRVSPRGRVVAQRTL